MDRLVLLLWKRKKKKKEDRIQSESSFHSVDDMAFGLLCCTAILLLPSSLSFISLCAFSSSFSHRQFHNKVSSILFLFFFFFFSKLNKRNQVHFSTIATTYVFVLLYVIYFKLFASTTILLKLLVHFIVLLLLVTNDIHIYGCAIVYQSNVLDIKHWAILFRNDFLLDTMNVFLFFFLLLLLFSSPVSRDCIWFKEPRTSFKFHFPNGSPAPWYSQNCLLCVCDN